jgi:rSAM-associated Gly-rich repeat protein
MSLSQKYLNILAGLLPAGAVGVSLALAAAMPATAKPEQPTADPQPAAQARIADRLAAIRGAVSDAGGAQASPAEQQLAWWAWRNGGGGWRNGGGWGWRNGGWGNGGWRNGGGGWRNGPWNNFWRNF